MFTFGQIYSFGVFLPAIKVHFNADLAAVAAINSVMTAMQFVGSLVAGLSIPRRLTHRSMAFISCVVVVAGHLVAAFVQSLLLLCVAMGLVGFGLGASNLAGLTALNARISADHRALAVGFAAC